MMVQNPGRLSGEPTLAPCLASVQEKTSGLEDMSPGLSGPGLVAPSALQEVSRGGCLEAGQMVPSALADMPHGKYETGQVVPVPVEGTTDRSQVGQVESSTLEEVSQCRIQAELVEPLVLEDTTQSKTRPMQAGPTMLEEVTCGKCPVVQAGHESPTDEQEDDSLSSEACSSPGAGTDSADDEEASSTESAQNGEEGSKKRVHIDAPRVQEKQLKAAAKISVLEQRIKELTQQKKELTIEMEMEAALLEGELRTEKLELHREEEAIRALQSRLHYSERKCQAEREQEKARLQEEKRKVEELERRFQESQRLLENQPECLREQLQKQIQEMSDALEAAVKAFEDLEFQQLEKESSLEEERETISRQIAQELSEHQCSLSKCKRKIMKLEEQLRQIKEQMESECRKLSEEKMDAIKDLHLEKEHLSELLEPQDNGGKSFPGSPEMMTKLMLALRNDQRVLLIGSDKCRGSSSSCLLSVNNLSIRNSLKSSTAVQRTNSLPRRRGEPLHLRPADRPISIHGNGQNGIITFQLANLSTITGTRGLLGSPSLQATRLQSPLYQLVNGVSNGHLPNTLIGKTPALAIPRLPCSLENAVPNIAEMERRLREAMAEKERLLKARETKRAAQEEAKKEISEPHRTTEPPTPQAASTTPPHTGPADTQAKSSVQPAVVRKPALDLKSHLESSGHSVETCGQVTVTATSCKGFLVKMGGRIKTWKKRWFVFDRQKRRLAYFADKEEQKLKGVIYFQAIEEVYYDHLRSAFKSPHPKLTFCVKTYERLFCMVAPTAEAMRIWMDVIVTAAEENSRY